MITRPTQWTILPEGEAIFHERATVITVEDEAAGEFLKVHQHHVNDGGTILIDPDEWPILKQAIDNAMISLRN